MTEGGVCESRLRLLVFEEEIFLPTLWGKWPPRKGSHAETRASHAEKIGTKVFKGNEEHEGGIGAPLERTLSFGASSRASCPSR